MPRKRSKPSVAKEAEIKIRLTSEDKALFEDAAARRGLSVSAWLRMLGLEAARTSNQQ